MKSFLYLIQGIFAYLFLYLVKLVPLDIASAIGGFFGRNIMIFSPWNSVAKRNIKKVYPNMSRFERKKLIREMWNNIGRVGAESIHLREIIKDSALNSDKARVNVKMNSKSEKLIINNEPIVFMGAHLSNWEIVRALQVLYSRDLGCVYREPNNTYVRKLLNRIREGDDEYKLYSKKTGMLEMIRDLKKGVCIGIIVDQWLTNGAKVKFLGIETKAPTVYANFAKKYGVHIIPIEFIRLNGKCRFEMIVHSEIEVKSTDSEEDIAQKGNDELSKMIFRNPNNWLWIHNRFKKMEEIKLKKIDKTCTKKTKSI